MQQDANHEPNLEMKTYRSLVEIIFTNGGGGCLLLRGKRGNLKWLFFILEETVSLKFISFWFITESFKTIFETPLGCPYFKH